MHAAVVRLQVNHSERDVYLRLLSDPQKRRIVRQLAEETDGRATVADLVDGILDAAAEHGADAAATRSQLAIQLHHVHLPKLAAHDVVAFDPDAGTVTYRDDDAVASVLEALQGERLPADV